MISIDEHEDSIRLKLLRCKNKKEVESVFANEGIKKPSEKTEYLYKAMQILTIYSASDINAPVPTEEEIYQYYLDFYLHYLWKEFTGASDI